jgi:hypothetical protein
LSIAGVVATVESDNVVAEGAIDEFVGPDVGATTATEGCGWSRSGDDVVLHAAAIRPNVITTETPRAVVENRERRMVSLPTTESVASERTPFHSGVSRTLSGTPNDSGQEPSLRERSTSVVGVGCVGVTPSSFIWSTRKFDRPSAVNQSPTVRAPVP